MVGIYYLSRIPLPQWVLEEMDKIPDLSYTNRYQKRNKEYISLGCDILPVLKGRSPMQAYSDFMRSFRNTFEDYLGAIVTVCILPVFKTHKINSEQDLMVAGG